jgi:hypothetical protein
MPKFDGPWGWVLAGAGMGLVIGFATRWYWGVLGFSLLAVVIAAAELGWGGRHGRRMARR